MKDREFQTSGRCRRCVGAHAWARRWGRRTRAEDVRLSAAGDFPARRLVDHALYWMDLIDPVVVDEQLPVRLRVDRFLGSARNG